MLVGSSGKEGDKPGDQGLNDKIALLEKELDKLKGTDANSQNKPAMESWLDNKKWIKKVSFALL